MCWGANENAQLGRAPSAEAGPPARVQGLPLVTRIFAGGSNTCAQAGPGALLCWGANESGQLRDGKVVARPTPAPVPGTESLTRVAIGNRGRAGSRTPDLTKNASYICGLTRDGRVLCWGDNDTGQLGDGTRIDRAVPTPVLGIDDAIMIDVGDVHACALRRTGRVLCWGRNEFGAVGDGTMGPSTVRPSPVEVQGLADVAGIALGGAHSCARRRDGEILCWGVNNFGQLGDGSNVLWPAPHPVVGLLAQSR
jgi:alpha-tubulin suppressor-like RCC1 family protein